MKLKYLGIIIAVACMSFSLPTNSQMSWDVRNLPVDHWSSSTGHPEYPGGVTALGDYIRDRLEYPEIAKENAIEGIVRVAFNIGSNGCVEDVRILESLGYGCDQEVMRLIREMPCWKPAVIRGRMVEKTVVIPVKFRLQPAF